MKLSRQDYEQAQVFIDQGRLDPAYMLAERNLSRDPDNAAFLAVMFKIMIESKKLTLAYTCAKRVTEIEPKDPYGWLNLGFACQELWHKERAERYYKKGLRLAQSDEQRHTLLCNLSAVMIDVGRYEAALAVCEDALKLNPQSRNAQSNKGFCQIALGQYKEGWKNYRHCIGSEWRPRQQYGKEPEWNGKKIKKGKVALYGEQGLGDQICFASMINDASERADLILDVDKRLVPLFKRSFPQCEFGTPTDVKASLPMGQVAEYLRTTPESFVRQAYLKPCPDREFMWRSLFESKDKPVIGIAWSGGIPKTGSMIRRVTLEQLLPLFRSIDAHWVSLQYKPATQELEAFRAKHPDVDIAEYPHATLSSDYDDTAALVSALDAVVSVPTAVVHLAGALGVRTIAMCAAVKCWKFHSGIPFHPCTLIEHSEDWGQTIEETASHLRDLCTESLLATTRDNPSLTTSHSLRLRETPASQSASPH